MDRGVMHTQRAGMLHTVPALAATFDSMVRSELVKVELVHVVDPWLLATAIEVGVTDAVRARVARHVVQLAELGMDAVLVTCSSIGEAVDATSSSVAIPVIRVDAPMAEEAVSIATAAGAENGRAGRIVVLATLDATLRPTGRLLGSYLESHPESHLESHLGAEVVTRVVAGAVDARDAGDQREHDRLVRNAAIAAADAGDVIVLAQASMAGALGDVTLRVPVLTSPTGAVAALTDALTDVVSASGAIE